MERFPFQVLEYFRFKSSIFFSLSSFSLLRPGLNFYFSGMELLFETGKVSDCLSCNGLGVGR